jgi:hypothetical protein
MDCIWSFSEGRCGLSVLGVNLAMKIAELIIGEEVVCLSPVDWYFSIEMPIKSK